MEIRARVDGFLDKRVYTEGQLVHAGQTLFLMDPKPFEAALQTARGQLAQQQARLYVTKANLARVIPLAAQNALSKKDLDDATGNEKSAEAAVIAAKGQVQTAELNLSYTTIKSPLNGLSSFARQQDGSYVTAGPRRLADVCLPARSDVGELQHLRERVAQIPRRDHQGQLFGFRLITTSS